MATDLILGSRWFAWELAERRFLAGAHSTEVVGTIILDPTFVSECELKGLQPLAEAKRIVRDVWPVKLGFKTRGGN